MSESTDSLTLGLVAVRSTHALHELDGLALPL
jgi:hypothetical protein